MLEEFAKKVWVAKQDQKFMGLELGTRMTIVRLSDGSLFVHSPIRPTDGLLQEINELGEVKYIVAPNLLHHLYFNEFSKNFPKATRYIAPKLNRKIRTIEFDEILEDRKQYPWSDEISHQFIGGAPWVNEVIFLAKESKTLIVTDTALHIQESSPFLTRIFLKPSAVTKNLAFQVLKKSSS